MLTGDNTELADPEWSHHWRQGGPITGEQVVPSHWRELAQSGPMRLAGDSHLPGLLVRLVSSRVAS